MPYIQMLCLLINMSDKEFKQALSKFSDSVIAQQLTGEFNSPFPKTWSQDPIDASLSIEKRLNLLKEELRGWVILKSQELEEFEEEELERIWGEAVGCMYAIRELERHFSEKT